MSTLTRPASSPATPAHTPNTTRITFTDVSVKYGTTTIISGFNEQIRGPGLCSITGANGVGKTTLLRLACGISLPTSGSVLIDGESTEKHWSSIRERLGVSLYSERSYHFRLTGLQNLIYFGRLAGLRKKETLNRLAPLRQEFTVDPLLERHFSDLSLGQRKIFGMLIALVIGDDLIILDEPTATLDTTNSLAALTMMQWVIARGVTVLISTHDQNLIAQSDQVVAL